MAAIFSPSRFILSSVPSETGGRVESRCSRWVYKLSPSDDGSDRTVTQRVVVHAPLLHAPDGAHQLIVVGLVLHRIDARGVDDQERRPVVFMEEPRVRIVEARQVRGVDGVLVADAAPRDPLQQ